MMTDGGTIGPMIDEATVSEAAKALEYPSFGIALMKIRPSEAISAMAVPEIPANRTEATILA